MTSNLSSAKQFRTSFLQSLKKFSFHGILEFLLLLPFFADIHSMFRNQEMYLSGLSDSDYLEAYVFALNRHMSTEEMGYVCLAVGLSAMFLALHCWRFLHVKKTLNVYCSLGVSRSTLFWSRFAACAVHLIAPVVLIFAGLLVSNLMLFGSTPELWTATGIYTLSFVAIAVFAFAMTTLAMCVSGASVESFLCSGCLIALPVTLFYGVKYLAAAMLKGNAVEHWLHNVASGETIHNGSFLPDFDYLDFFLPVSDYRFSDGFEWYKMDGEWMNPGWSYPLVWLAVGAVLCMLSFICFKHRKNENAGFLGKNPALVGVSCLSLAFLLAMPAYFVMDTADIRIPGLGAVLIALGTLILLLVYTIIMAILLRGKKTLAKAMPVALSVCAVFVIVCVIFQTGGFGYENRIPDKEKIESVSVSCGGYPQFADADSSFYESYYGDLWYEDNELHNRTDEKFALDHLSYFYSDSASLICDLTDEKDIDTVLAVHKIMTEAKEEELALFGYPVAFQYKLKNGKTVTRYYEKATPEVMELLRDYENHEDVKTNYAHQFDDIYIENVSLIAPAASSVTVIPWNILEQGFETDLRKALVQDIKDGNMPICRFDNVAPLGYISLSGNIRSYDQDYDYSYDYEVVDYGYEVVYATTAVAFEDRYVGPEFSEPKTFTIAQLSKDFEYCDLNNIYPVYADMKATVAVLEKYDLLQYLSVAEQPVSAKLLRTPFADGKAENVGHFRSQYFRGTYLAQENMSFSDIMPDGKFAQDATVLAELVKNSFLHYPVTQDGCFVAFEYADGTSVLTYVPIENVPENLR
ncbi:MAG: hypothetical protein E7523_07795 [Ruminococcaceae bacterium]|nr:hypothetical protein [Oscillospiraceae bacterium]